MNDDLKNLGQRLAGRIERLLETPLGEAERRAAVAEFAAAARLEPADAERLAERLPPVPKPFVDKWAAAFGAEAARSMAGERLALMLQGSERADLLLLVEFFAFLEEREAHVQAELHDLARAAGERPEDLVLGLEALATYTEKRLHAHFRRPGL